MKTLLLAVLVGLFSLSTAQNLPVTFNPTTLLENPYDSCLLQVTTDKNPDGINTIPTYLVGESMSLFVSSACHLQLYLFSIGADNSVNLLPGAKGELSPTASIEPHVVRNLYDNGHTFTVQGPIGLDRIYVLGTQQVLSVEQVVQFAAGLRMILNAPKPQHTYLPLKGVKPTSWSGTLARYLVGQVNIPF